MKKHFMIVATIALVIGGVLFKDQVLAVFRGMSPLEAMQKIVTFMLHIVVVTIFSYVLYTLPELVRPWLQALRWKRRSARWNRRGAKVEAAKPGTPKLTADQLLRAYILQQLPKSRRSAQIPPQQDDIHLNF